MYDGIVNTYNYVYKYFNNGSVPKIFYIYVNSVFNVITKYYFWVRYTYNMHLKHEQNERVVF